MTTTPLSFNIDFLWKKSIGNWNNRRAIILSIRAARQIWQTNPCALEVASDNVSLPHAPLCLPLCRFLYRKNHFIFSRHGHLHISSNIYHCCSFWINKNMNKRVWWLLVIKHSHHYEYLYVHSEMDWGGSMDIGSDKSLPWPQSHRKSSQTQTGGYILRVITVFQWLNGSQLQLQLKLPAVLQGTLLKLKWKLKHGSL